MKVSVAARLFSNTMAAAMEAMVGTNSASGNLPVESMHTAEFIHYIDILFETFNGRSPRPEHGKQFKRCMSLKSRHRNFWLKLLPKMEGWEFISRDSTVRKTKMPCKQGWKPTIKTTLELFNECQKIGFRFLRTKTLNQDPLYFSSIRNLNTANTNPNFFKFSSALKPWVVNNLINFSNKKDKNCEDDNGTILANLQTFLEEHQKRDEVPLMNIDECEFKEIDIPQITNFNDDYDLQITSYVAGFVTKKIYFLKL